jgi:hypothetical protein
MSYSACYGATGPSTQFGGVGKKRKAPYASRAAGGKANTPKSMRHGGSTGHFSGRPGPFAATPHNGMLAKGRSGGFKANGGGLLDGPYAGAHGGGQHARGTGWQAGKGNGGSGYFSATPQDGSLADAGS